MKGYNEAYGDIGTKGIVSSGAVSVPSLSAGIARIKDRPLSVLDVIPPQALGETNSYSFFQERTRELKAAEVAKSGLKPTSKIQVKLIEGQAATIAHLTEPIPNQDLEDASLLRDYIDTALRMGVSLRLQEQIIAGKGENAELKGFSKESGIQESASRATGLTPLGRRS